MGSKNPNSIVWGNTGVEFNPDSYSYVEGERPVDAYDDFFNWSVSKDVIDLFGYIGTLEGIDGVERIDYGTTANRPAAGTAGAVYISSDEKLIYVDDGSDWNSFGVQDYNNLNNRSHGNEDHDKSFLAPDDLTKARGATYSGNYSTLQNAVDDADNVVIVDPSASYGDVNLGGGIDLIGYAPPDEYTHNIGTITISGSGGARVKNVNPTKVIVKANATEVSGCIVDEHIKIIDGGGSNIGNHSRITNNDANHIDVGDVHNVVVSNNVTRNTNGTITTHADSSSNVIASNVGYDITDNGTLNKVGLNVQT